jgi:hypothetical protein
MESNETRQSDEGERNAGTARTPSRQYHHLADAAATIKQQAEYTAGKVAETVTGAATQEKDNAAERIGEIAKVVHGTADQLREQLPQASGLIDGAADALERASTTLSEGSLQDLMGNLNKFAREQPALFFGGAILAGISLSRFIKSSDDTHRRPTKS